MQDGHNIFMTFRGARQTPLFMFERLTDAALRSDPGFIYGEGRPGKSCQFQEFMTLVTVCQPSRSPRSLYTLPQPSRSRSSALRPPPLVSNVLPPQSRKSSVAAALSLPRRSRFAESLRMTPARPRGRPPYRRPRKLRALSPPALRRRPQSCEGRRRHPRGPNGDTLPLLRHPDVALKTHTHSRRLTRLPRWAPNPGLALGGIIVANADPQL
ncbi:hypothetical protein K523DRAFT_156333 [Schizophyllum commune Tattone D]|nr:hypothetical protein K523DRAFT_156333 [Schizophyllum commune Tattone D]